MERQRPRREDRPDRHTDGERRADRPAARGPAELVALQRSAGNQRVAALVAASRQRTLARRIGFEFQTGVKLSKPSKFTRNTPIERHGTWSIDPDEIKKHGQDGEACDLEYVTEPFEDNDAGGLRSTMEAMRDHAGLLVQDQKLGAGQDVNVDSVPATVTAAPQATVGVSLDKIGALIDARANPILAGMVPTNTGQTPTLFGMSDSGGQNLADARAAAQAAVTRAPGAKGFTGNREPVLGFLTLVYSYLLSSQRLEGADKPLKYAKLLAPMMTRTNFRALFLQVERDVAQLLDFDVPGEHFRTTQQLTSYWTASAAKRISDVEGAFKEDFPDWILKGTGIGAGKLVFPQGYKTPDLPGEKPLKGPTRQQWLESIVSEGQSVLSEAIEGQKEYLARLKQVEGFMPSRTDALSPVPFGSTSMGLRVKENPQKLGTYQVQNPFEVHPNELRALLELRRLPKGVPAPRWPDYALAVQAALWQVNAPPPTVTAPQITKEEETKDPTLVATHQ